MLFHFIVHFGFHEILEDSLGMLASNYFSNYPSFNSRSQFKNGREWNRIECNRMPSFPQLLYYIIFIIILYIMINYHSIKWIKVDDEMVGISLPSWWSAVRDCSAGQTFCLLWHPAMAISTKLSPCSVLRRKSLRAVLRSLPPSIIQ